MRDEYQECNVPQDTCPHTHYLQARKTSLLSYSNPSPPAVLLPGRTSTSSLVEYCAVLFDDSNAIDMSSHSLLWAHGRICVGQASACASIISLPSFPHYYIQQPHTTAKPPHRLHLPIPSPLSALSFFDASSMVTLVTHTLSLMSDNDDSDHEFTVEQYYAEASRALASLGLRERRQPENPLDSMTIARLRQEAEQIKKTIDSLKYRRDVIEEQLKTVVYPVDTLPPEILCKIFAAVVFSAPRTQVDVALLRLTAVSQRWRAVAIADPHLWTRTCYFIRFSNHCDTLHQHFLQRAQGLPITLSTTGFDLVPDRLPRGVFDSASQWIEAHLQAGFNAFDLYEATFRRATSLPVFVPFDFDFPQLTKLTLDIPNIDRFNNSRSQRNVFQSAVHLRELAVSNILSISQFAIPTQRLRKLTVNGPAQYLDVILILPELLMLEELSLLTLVRNPESDAEIIGNPSRPLPCPLKTLHLSYFTFKDVKSYIHPDHPCLTRSNANILSLFIVSTWSYKVIQSLVFSRNSPVFHSTQEFVLRLFDMDAESGKLLAADFAQLAFLPNLESLTLVVPQPREGKSTSIKASSLTIEIGPFVDGLAMRVANALSAGVRHTMKLSRFVVDCASSAISDKDLGDLKHLQDQLQVPVLMPNGHPSRNTWERRELRGKGID
ncbi:F-box domain-containing protein [Mycena indigotica]|uniref:F-box domain-containing protein n=1 Tax=Mycena indigotica TaxID=2126181 RepID=A0A8H6TCM8_9AGAR|nr:F-box domain-containing protein [Mycena indigotica]KAF7314869.1 F-box domain-containing protein [Mycena indigotica]